MLKNIVLLLVLMLIQQIAFSQETSSVIKNDSIKIHLNNARLINDAFVSLFECEETKDTLSVTIVKQDTTIEYLKGLVLDWQNKSGYYQIVADQNLELYKKANTGLVREKKKKLFLGFLLKISVPVMVAETTWILLKR